MKSKHFALLLFAVIVLLFIGTWVSGYLVYQKTIERESAREAELLAKLTTLTEETKTNTEKFDASIALITESLNLTQEESARLAEELEEEQEEAEKRLREISGTVGDLEKLSKTDPELLQKYSKVFFLNEHYAPARLATIDPEYLYNEARIYKIHTDVKPYLIEMLEEAKADGVEIYVFSAFRSYNEQTQLKSNYTVTYGAGSANQFSADQGYSEHQLGTTVDLITTGLGGQLSGFQNTAAFTWLQNNAHRFGFILSYPENNTHYVYEPWHWRFVGVDLAKDLKKDGKNFYDLDQREIDEYLIKLFD